MCVSLRPARFSDTVVGAFEDRKGKRYLAYGNVAQSLLPRPVPRPHPVPHPMPRPRPYGSRGSRNLPGIGLTAPRNPIPTEGAVTPQPTQAQGNAMILPIPDLDYKNVQIIDTTTAPNFLKDIQRTLTPAVFASDGGRGVGRGMAKAVEARIVNFDIYSIVIASDLASLKFALRKVPVERQPELDLEILNAYSKWYPGWTLTLWCFNNTDAQRAKPVLIQYDPTAQKNKDDFFVPTLDGHDGKVPDLKAEVGMDHTVFVATNDMPSGAGVYYQDQGMAPGVREILPTSIRGRNVSGSFRNGDLWYKRAELKKGTFQGYRLVPPGATRPRGKTLVV